MCSNLTRSKIGAPKRLRIGLDDFTFDAVVFDDLFRRPWRARVTASTPFHPRFLRRDVGWYDGVPDVLPDAVAGGSRARGRQTHGRPDAAPDPRRHVSNRVAHHHFGV